MIHDSAKISSVNSGMLEKGHPSIYVQIRVTQHWKTTKNSDFWPFTILPRYACGAVTQYPLNAAKIYNQYKMHKIHFPFLWLFCSVSYFNSSMCLCLTHQRGSSISLSQSCPIIISRLTWALPFSAFPSFQGSQENQKLLIMEVGRHLSLAQTPSGVWQYIGTRPAWWTHYSLSCIGLPLAYLSLMKSVAAYIGGNGKDKCGMLIPEITQWVPCNI